MVKSNPHSYYQELKYVPDITLINALSSTKGENSENKMAIYSTRNEYSKQRKKDKIVKIEMNFFILIFHACYGYWVRGILGDQNPPAEIPAQRYKVNNRSEFLYSIIHACDYVYVVICVE